MIICRVSVAFSVCLPSYVAAIFSLLLLRAIEYLQNCSFPLPTNLEPISFTLQDSDENVTQETSSIDWCFGLSITGIIFVYSLLLLFAFKTVHRNSEWQNKETLAISGLKVNPTNAKIHVTLGNFLASKVSHDSHRTHQQWPSCLRVFGPSGLRAFTPSCLRLQYYSIGRSEIQQGTGAS